MLLSLLVTSSQSRVLGTAVKKTFNEDGGTIGRGKNKDWVLPDPNHHISNSHAIIDFHQGAYYIVDTSTNGVFINDSRVPLGKNNRLKLNEGDYIFIGEYEIAVSLESEDAVSAASPENSATLFDDYQGDIPASMDPLDLISSKKSKKAEEEKVYDDNLMQDRADDHLKDQAPALDEYFEPPKVFQEKAIPDDWNVTNFPSTEDSGESKEYIPDDWELTGFSLGKSKKSPQSPKIDKKIKVERKRPATPGIPEGEKLRSQKRQVKPPQVDDMKLLLDSMGLDIDNIPPEVAKKLPEIVGLVFREFVQGTMDVLMARSDLKGALRVDQTMIRPTENNPLKFSVSVDAALENMLLKKGAGFLHPQDAVQEGFKDIKAHQLAMMAGMQGALKGVLERFDPEELEESFSLGPTGSKLFSVYNKSRFWDQYKELYKKNVREAMDNFQRLLGEKFASSYEEQMKKLDATDRKRSRKG